MFESDRVRVTLTDGLATLHFRAPGQPQNPLGLSLLLELDAALAAVSRHPSIDVLILRGRPEAFCGGFDRVELAACQTAGDFAAWSATGQQVLQRLRRLPPVTLAWLDGVCRGPGLELALACDRRLAVIRPSTNFGPDPTGLPACWGDRPLPETDLSPRQAVAQRLVDAAVSPRQAKIHLWALALREQYHGSKPPRPTGEPAAIRQRFVSVARPLKYDAPVIQAWRTPPPVRLIVLAGRHPMAIELAARAVTRGQTVIAHTGGDDIHSHLDSWLRSGWLTSLDAEQALARVVAREATPWDCDMVLDASPDDLRSAPAAAGVVFEERSRNQFPRPDRVLSMNRVSGSYEIVTSASHDALRLVTTWLDQLGLGWRCRSVRLHEIDQRRAA